MNTYSKYLDLISVIVPIYNGAHYIERCIKSILNSSYRNLEIILIDDGSTDQTYSIISKMSFSDQRIKLFNLSHKGVSSARNLGLENAHGKYIGFVDSDDYINEDMFEKMMAKMGTSDLVVCNNMILKDEKIEPAVSFPCGSYNNEEIIQALFTHKLQGSVWRMLFRKEIIKKHLISFPSIKLSEDMYFCCEYLLNINKVTVIPDKCYIYNVSNKNSVVQNQGDACYLTDYIHFPYLLKSLFQKYGKYDDFKSYIAHEIVITAMSIRLMKPFHEFRKYIKNDIFRKSLDDTAIKSIKGKKYKLYYWALCKKYFQICNLGYWFNFLKSRFPPLQIITTYQKKYLLSPIKKVGYHSDIKSIFIFLPVICRFFHRKFYSNYLYETLVCSLLSGSPSSPFL